MLLIRCLSLPAIIEHVELRASITPSQDKVLGLSAGSISYSICVVLMLPLLSSLPIEKETGNKELKALAINLGQSKSIVIIFEPLTPLFSG